MPETTPGGRGLKFWCALRIRVDKKSLPTKEKDTLEKKLGPGHVLSVRQIKTKNGPSGKTGQTYFIYNKGFDLVTEVEEVGLEKEVIEKVTTQSRKWVASDGTVFEWNTREGSFESKFTENDELTPYFYELEKAVRNSLTKVNYNEEGLLDEDEVEQFDYPDEGE